MTGVISTGVPSTRLKLKFKNSKSISAVENAMKKIALYMEGEIKSSIAGEKAEPTSVDTGAFLNSVKSESSTDDAIIFSNIFYAKHLEYGTSRMNERRHFRNSLNRNKEKINAFINSQIKKL